MTPRLSGSSTSSFEKAMPNMICKTEPSEPIH